MNATAARICGSAEKMGTASRLPAFCSVSAVDAVAIDPSQARRRSGRDDSPRSFRAQTGWSGASGLRRGGLRLGRLRCRLVGRLGSVDGLGVGRVLARRPRCPRTSSISGMSSPPGTRTGRPRCRPRRSPWPGGPPRQRLAPAHVGIDAPSCRPAGCAAGTLGAMPKRCACETICWVSSMSLTLTSSASATAVEHQLRLDRGARRPFLASASNASRVLALLGQPLGEARSSWSKAWIASCVPPRARPPARCPAAAPRRSAAPRAPCRGLRGLLHALALPSRSLRSSRSSSSVSNSLASWANSSSASGGSRSLTAVTLAVTAASRSACSPATSVVVNVFDSSAESPVSASSMPSIRPPEPIFLVGTAPRWRPPRCPCRRPWRRGRHDEVVLAAGRSTPVRVPEAARRASAARRPRIVTSTSSTVTANAEASGRSKTVARRPRR